MEELAQIVASDEDLLGGSWERAQELERLVLELEGAGAPLGDQGRALARDRGLMFSNVLDGVREGVR